jgi:hypothetical protein
VTLSILALFSGLLSAALATQIGRYARLDAQRIMLRLPRRRRLP